MATPTEKLEKAFRESDDRRRPKRVERIIWLSEHMNLPSAIVGRTETMHLLQEARDTFVDGHFAAALLLAVSVINHSLIEELQLRKIIENDPGLSTVLSKTEEHNILNAEWLPVIRKIVSIRHPYVHFKEPDHKHGLSMRTINEKTHPAYLLEADAREAMVIMYRVFKATLHQAV